MLKNEDRKDYEDLLKQVGMLQSSNVLDIDGDGRVDLFHIQTIMTLLGEPKCPPDRIDEIKALFEDDTGEDDTKVPLDIFLIKIRNHLQSYGSEKEVGLLSK
jgi:Ca2+-binding EF-hand superfamily protein